VSNTPNIKNNPIINGLQKKFYRRFGLSLQISKKNLEDKLREGVGIKSCGCPTDIDQFPLYIESLEKQHKRLSVYYANHTKHHVVKEGLQTHKVTKSKSH
jgi:hypothetical protein